MISIKKSLRFIMPLAIIGFLIFEVIEHVNSGDITSAIETLRNLTIFQISLVVFLGFIVNSTKYFYDVVILKYYSIRLPRWQIYRSALFANNIGSISGAGMRYYLYRESLQQIDCLRLSVLIFLSSYLGLAILNVFALLGRHTEKGIFLQYSWLEFTMIAIVLIIPVFFFADYSRVVKKWLIKKGNVESLNYMLKLRLAAVSLLDWFSTTVLFCYVCSIQTNEISISNSMAIFAVSSTIAVISYMPGGLGSFDYTAAASLRLLNTPMYITLSTIALFRMVNTFIPLLIGGAINLPTIIRRWIKS